MSKGLRVALHPLDREEEDWKDLGSKLFKVSYLGPILKVNAHLNHLPLPPIDIPTSPNLAACRILRQRSWVAVSHLRGHSEIPVSRNALDLLECSVALEGMVVQEVDLSIELVQGGRVWN
jgi:hypothetical protein